MKEEELTRYLRTVNKLYETEEEIQELKLNICVTTDTVKGSMAEYPYTEHCIKVSGLSETEERIKQKRVKELETQRQNLLREVEEAKNFVYQCVNRTSDNVTRKILRLRYLKGMTQKNIGKRLHIPQSTVARKINKLLDKKSK